MGRVVDLAKLYNRTNRFHKAEKLLRRTVQDIKSRNIDDDWLIGLAESELGYSLYKQSKDLEAEGLLINGYNLLKKKKRKELFHKKKSITKIIEFYKYKNREDKVAEFTNNLK
ncbi:MAG: hypothetical protein H6613_16255 [Ignavibacteriales bacterium]|nr:hypothetical protein [Ignavibacteriales bacterium]